MPRGIEAIAAAIGVLKAGAVFCFINTEYPEERVQFIIKDTGAKLVLKEKDLLSLPQIPLPAITPAPQNSSLVVYTSGSTGNQKGGYHGSNKT